MRYAVSAIILVTNIILQSTLFEYISIIGIKPNTAIIIIISMAFMRGEMEGALTGFVAGLLQDCFFAPFFGFYTFVYMLIGYFSGMFFKGFYKENFLIPLLLTIAFNFIFEFLYYSFNILLKGYTDILYFLSSIILPEIVYTAVFSIFIYKLLYLINSKLEKREHGSQKFF